MPAPPPQADLERCIVDCLECYTLCRQLSRPGIVEDCHEICRVTADFLLRRSGRYRELCAVCLAICEACAEALSEIEGAEDGVRACRGCAASCRRLLKA